MIQMMYICIIYIKGLYEYEEVEEVGRRYRDKDYSWYNTVDNNIYFCVVSTTNYRKND
jgi:hypothetical protein